MLKLYITSCSLPRSPAPRVKALKWIEALGHDAMQLQAKHESSWNKFTAATLLHEACQQGVVSMCAWLWDRGARDTTNADNHNRCSPLFWACWRGNLDVIQWLCAHGAAADVRTPNRSHWTPLLFSSWHGHLHVVKVRGGSKNGVATSSLLASRSVA
jgi:ankyrin repeat protein